MDNDKAYVITSGEYSHYTVHGVYSTREKAVSVIGFDPESPDVKYKNYRYNDPDLQIKKERRRRKLFKYNVLHVDIHTIDIEEFDVDDMPSSWKEGS